MNQFIFLLCIRSSESDYIISSIYTSYAHQKVQFQVPPQLGWDPMMESEFCRMRADLPYP